MAKGRLTTQFKSSQLLHVEWASIQAMATLLSLIGHARSIVDVRKKEE